MTQKSKHSASLAALFLSIIILIVAVVLRKTDHTPLFWWEYTDVFFLFIASFSWLVANLFTGKVPPVASRMNVVALVCLILAVIAFIVNFFLMV